MRIRAIQLIAASAFAAAACYGQTISTWGGTLYSACSLADGAQALTACMSPGGMVMDKLGNLYYADGRYYKIRKIDRTGIVTTLAFAALLPVKIDARIARASAGGVGP